MLPVGWSERSGHKERKGGDSREFILRVPSDVDAPDDNILALSEINAACGKDIRRPKP